MRRAMARFVVAVALVAAFGYVLQVDDSTLKPVAVQSRAEPVAEAALVPGSRQYYSAHRAVVPFGRTSLEIPILLYHYIRVPPPPRLDPVGYNLSVAPQVFQSQMDWLAAHGYHPVTFQDVRLYWRRVAQLPSKPVIITLDDGYQDLYKAAYPILFAHGFQAVAYIVTGFVGQPGYVTANELVEMDGHGIEIGAHTVDHADLSRAQQAWLTYQLVESKRWLEKLLGHPVPDMAYPSGKFNARTMAAAQRAGYDSAVTTQYSVLHSPSDRYEWGRVRVSSGEPQSLFIANLGPAMPTVMITTTFVASKPAAMQLRT